jgi:hypothetical protein
VSDDSAREGARGERRLKSLFLNFSLYCSKSCWCLHTTLDIRMAGIYPRRAHNPDPWPFAS